MDTKNIEAKENNSNKAKSETFETQNDRDFGGLCNLCELDFPSSRAVLQHQLDFHVKKKNRTPSSM